MKRRLFIVLVVLLIIAAPLAYWRYVRTQRAPRTQYKTAPIERRTIVGRITASGTLQALVTVQVGSQVSGRIQHLYVDFNSPVKKGQLVAKIDPQLFQAAAEQARANFMSAQAGVAKAKAQALDADRQYARTKGLRAEGLASQAELDTAETTAGVARAQIDVANAALEQARAALNQAQVNVSYTKIVSPIDGVVISRSVDVGQTVAASFQAPVLFTIAEDLRKMQVNTSVAEGDVGRLEAGMVAYFTVDAFPGQRFKGIISQIRNAAQTVQNVVTYDAVIEVDNADLRLRPGMTANVTIVYDERDNVTAVPNPALRFRPPSDVSAASASAARDAGSDMRTVWALRGGTAQPVAVRVGLTDGTVTELRSSELKAGDAVVVDATTPGASPGPSGTAAGAGAVMRRMF